MGDFSLGGITSQLNRDVVSLRVRRWQRSYNWEVLLPMLGIMPGELVAPTIQAIDYNDYEMTEPAQMKDGAYSRYAVGDLSKRAFNISFLETEEGIVAIYLNAWRDMMITSNGLWKKKLGANGYARNIFLMYLTADGLPLRTVQFYNAFPLKFYEAKLDYADNSLLRLTIPFQCDRVIEESVGQTIEQAAQGVFNFATGALKGLLSQPPAQAVTLTPQAGTVGEGAAAGSYRDIAASAAEDTIKGRAGVGLANPGIGIPEEEQLITMRASDTIANTSGELGDVAKAVNTTRAATPLATGAITIAPSKAQMAADAIAKIPANNWGDKTIQIAQSPGVTQALQTRLAGNLMSADRMAADAAIRLSGSSPLANMNAVNAAKIM